MADLADLTVTAASGAGDDLRCSPWTRAAGVDPIGTAGTHDRFLLVESPLPWPSDVSEIPALAAAAGADRRVRVLAVVPGGGGAGGEVSVTDWCRVTANRFVGTDHRVAADDTEALLATLLVDPAGSPGTVVGDAPPEVLVCGHGRRDRCCGRWGTLLQTELAAALPGLLPAPDPTAAAPVVRVRRCSHTGGHRFAPTAVTLPDGRFWAHLDVDLTAGIVGRTLDPRALRRHYRGTTALDMWAQAVERELLVAAGWTWLEADLTDARTVVADDRRRAEVHLGFTHPAGDGSITATVEVVRDVPVLVCGEPPEVATKSCPELAVVARTVVLPWGSPPAGP